MIDSVFSNSYVLRFRLSTILKTTLNNSNLAMKGLLTDEKATMLL